MWILVQMYIGFVIQWGSYVFFSDIVAIKGVSIESNLDNLLNIISVSLSH